ncbi:hypothetical protein BJX63DRAFT_438618 [Aspergillus granulosus]|uniref:Uncharacterized protein n=1 Tax=Aspergillus granulosus TaxID=176169 RepID=A0ABR4GT60_9EURO
MSNPRPASIPVPTTPRRTRAGVAFARACHRCSYNGQVCSLVRGGVPACDRCVGLSRGVPGCNPPLQAAEGAAIALQRALAGGLLPSDKVKELRRAYRAAARAAHAAVAAAPSSPAPATVPAGSSVGSRSVRVFVGGFVCGFCVAVMVFFFFLYSY